MSDSRYKMSISLNVLNHLGLNLYSNTPAVLAEAIANAWDADATRVDISFSRDAFTIADNGIGMDLDDINKKYLTVGYQKREDAKKSGKPLLTPIKKRHPMGRKGIGKLSLFSIANKIEVHSRKSGGRPESLLMDAAKITEAIKSENPSESRPYEPEEIEFDSQFGNGDSGTMIRITDLKKRVISATAEGLIKRIARRFGVIGEASEFAVFLNDKQITFADRDYFDKARFLFQYGDQDYVGHCNNLDKNDDGQPICDERRPYRFDGDGHPDENGEYEIKGWIAMSHHSNDLDDKVGGEDDNLNKITVVVRGKVAQEDILHEHRIGGMFTKFLYGEIHANFLDDDEKEDIATSSRQKIYEDDGRYKALKEFIRRELVYIWNATNKLKDEGALRKALSFHPHIGEWYNNLPSRLRNLAKKIFGAIDRSSADDKERGALYADGILAFEALKVNSALDQLVKIDSSNFDEFISFVSHVDMIEAARYHDIMRMRICTLQLFNKMVDKNKKEKFLQKYIVKHPWLLDPAWERAISHLEMEKSMQAVIDGMLSKSKVYLDIRYTRISRAHVVIELKRANRRLNRLEIEGQLRKYMDSVKREVEKQGENLPLEGICIVGELPKGWDNPETRRDEEAALKIFSIRVVTYKELIANAFGLYSEYLKAHEQVKELHQLVKPIREHKR